MLGAASAAWAAVNVNYRYVTDELAYVLDDAAVDAIMFHGRFADTLASVLPRLAHSPRLLLQVDDGSGAGLLPGALDYEQALSSVDPIAWPPPWPLSPDDRYVLYTGGTTGHPKGVLWRQADFLATCLGVTASVAELVEAAPLADLRVLPAPPLMHGAAHWNAMSAWIAGGTVVIQQHPDRLDAADLLDTCEREHVSSLLVVGDAFARPLVEELRRRPHALPDLRFVLSGGAVLSATVKDELLDVLPQLRIVDILGSSETGRQGVQSDRAGAPASTGTFARSHASVVLSEDRTHELDPGADELGWVAQEGRVPLGYLGDRAKTEATFRQIDGRRFAIAGDRARLLSDGSIELHGRDSVTINTGGEKVFAEEVEQALKRHPAVYDTLVVGRPSERWGQEVAAVVALRPGAEVDAESLRATCAAHLARYKLPRTIVFRDAVQRSPSGKPDYVWARSVVDIAQGDT
jgi:fatty-acyl-CoA synthase